jgi:hypothetical protein
MDMCGHCFSHSGQLLLNVLVWFSKGKKQYKRGRGQVFWPFKLPAMRGIHNNNGSHLFAVPI